MADTSGTIGHPGAYTVGNSIFSEGQVQGDLLRHEKAHVEQYDWMGFAFLPIQFMGSVASDLLCGDNTCNPTEIAADKRAGIHER